MRNNWNDINVDIILVIWLKQHTGCSGGIKEDLVTCITQDHRQSIQICINFDNLNSSWPGPLLLHHATFTVSGGGGRFSLLVVASCFYSGISWICAYSSYPTTHRHVFQATKQILSNTKHCQPLVCHISILVVACHQSLQILAVFNP